MSSQIPARSSARIPALDGLRGLAASVVVVHHVLLTVPAFALAYQFTDPRRSHTWTDVFVLSPLHIIWDGPAAVSVFFILSGYVLAAPYAAGKVGGWRSYYPQRLLRLYLPVWASLVLALVTVAIVRRHVVTGATYFVNLHASTPHGVGQALRNATLLAKTGWLDSPLWSLRFEVGFSVLLPLALIGGRIWGRWWLGKIGACLIVITIGAFMHSLLLLYTPMFGLGTILAYERERITCVTRRIRPREWWAVAIGIWLLVTAYWDMWGLGLGAISGIGLGLSAVGASLLVASIPAWPAARRFAETPLVQWLGKRSFSIYLVHEPIIVGTAFALGGRPNAALTFAIAVPLALLVAEGFFRVIEAPSHRLSRSVGKKVRARSSNTTFRSTYHEEPQLGP